MAKKAKEKAVQDPTGKVRFELRFDSDVYDRIKALADGAEISVNQLMQGIARWAGKHAHLGEVEIDREDGSVHEADKKQLGCVWFGREESMVFDAFDEPQHHDNGEVWFALDFTERKVIREEFSYEPEEIDPEEFTRRVAVRRSTESAKKK